MRLLAALLAVLVTVTSHHASARAPAFDGDGWYSWQVDAIDGSPALCCYEWRRGRVSNPGCDLDRQGRSFNTDRSLSGGAVKLEVYVRVVSGVIREIETVSPGCPVHSSTPIADLGDVQSADSVDIMAALIDAGGDLAKDGLQSITFHRGAKAADKILTTGRSHSDPEMRAEAWFWLAQRASPKAGTEIHRAIAEDVDEDVREEAVFALSQLPEDRAVRALIAVVEDRRLDRQRREEALFWLAQTEAQAAYDYIDALISRN